MKKLFLFVLMMQALWCMGQNITGAWKGDMEIPGTRLPLIIHLVSHGDSLSGTFDSPAQNAFDIPFTSVQLRKDSLILQAQNLKATYLSKFVAKDSLSGVWKQGTASFPMSLHWYPESSTPHNNKNEKEVSIGVSGANKISGTLLSSSHQQPLVIIIAGSGPTDRNGNNALGVSAESYLFLAHELFKNNIATFRYDKRGIRKSSAADIHENTLRFTDFSNDADSIFQYFRNEGFQKIFIAGHSEGSLLGMLVAQVEKPAGYISISGISETADKILAKQMSGQIPGVTDAMLDTLLGNIRTGQPVTSVPLSLQTVFRPSIQPYLHSWFQYDPLVEIKKVSCPVLILQGTCDIQVGVENATALFNAAKKSIIKIVPNMSHTLKDAGKDCVNQKETYTDRDVPLAPGLVEDIASFVKTHSE